MKRKVLRYFLAFINILFAACLTIKADLIDYSSGNLGSSGSIGSGSWSSKYVGAKISIVNSSNVVEDVEIFVNKNGKAGKFSYENLPKTKQSYNITWVDSSKRTAYINKNLPNKWLNSSDKNINLHSYLAADDYELLIELIETKNAFTTLSPGDYILVEPMVYIGGYYGTGFELGRAFLKLGNCGSSGSFCYTYGKRIFGGSSKMSGGGLFFTTLYVGTTISDVGIYNMTKWLKNNPDVKTDSKYKDRHKCIMAKSCGRGIGVFKYDDIYSGKLKIIKKDSSSGANLSGAGFTLYSDSSCSKKIKNEQKTNSNGELVFNNLSTGKYYYKETTVPSGYTGNSNCMASDVTNKKTTTVTINNNKNQTVGNLTIYIKKYIDGKETNELILSPNSQASYNIYKGSNCSGPIIKTVKTSSGYVPKFNLDVGTYSIGETINPSGTPNFYTIAPPGYSPENTKCVKSNISIIANSDLNESIFYEASCQQRLKDSDKSPASLIKLYEEFGYNGLLNFKDNGKYATCDDVTCKKNPDEPPTLGCLSYSTGEDVFDEYNMVCHTEKITNLTGSTVGFCIDKFNLTNNLNENNFYSTAGQFIIRKNLENKIQFYKNPNELVVIDNQYIATANVGKICYVLDNSGHLQMQMKTKSLDVYFGDNDFDDEPDELPYEVNSITLPNTISNGFIKYEYKDIYNFGLNAVYLEKITGQITDKTIGSLEETGVIIPFKPIENKKILFEIEYDNKIYSSNECKYKSDPEIIKYPPDRNDGKLDLEFRLINKNKPFLNEKGDVRLTNSNWCDYSAPKEEQCLANNKIVVENIINATDSYGRDLNGKKNPIYTIKLFPSDIKLIRKYNDEVPYDNYNISCKTGKPCENIFISDLKNGLLKKYENNIEIETYGSISQLNIDAEYLASKLAAEKAM